MEITLDNYLPDFFGILTLIFLISSTFLYFRQPVIIAYILAGIILGPDGFGLVQNIEIVKFLGSIGVVLLLFYLGMEIPFKKFAKNWRLFLLGTLLQVIVTLCAVAIIGIWLNWSAARIVLLGFVISLSSTSIIINLLKDNNELETPIGTSITGILLTQDLIIVPMMIIISLFDHKQSIDYLLLTKQAIGSFAIVLLVVTLLRSQNFKLPFGKIFQHNEDLQILFVLLLCFGMSLITYLFGLSTAMGAFLAGLIVNAARETHWVKAKTEPFRIVFMGLFFISIGIIIDIQFILENFGILMLLTFLTFTINTFLNSAILRFWKKPTAECIYGGAMLAQIGEFSFILAAIGLESGIIGTFSYQTTISLISITLFLSPAWVRLMRKLFAVSPINTHS